MKRRASAYIYKNSFVLISDKKVRIYGNLAFAVIFYCFFMLDMFFYPFPIKNLVFKTLLVTLVFTPLVWESARFVILKIHKRWSGVQYNLKRKLIVASILVPYAFLLGLLRIYIEGTLNLWNVPVKNVSVFLLFTGITMLFILLEVALYESLFFVERWQAAQIEANELKKLNLQMQFDSLKVQIQPHFLFNTLNTLIGLIEGDQKRAISFTEDLAFVYRYLLEANQSTLISLEEELKFAKTYFSLLKTRYSEGLFLKEEMDHVSGFEVPPLSLQILIENAVKHNSITKAKPLLVNIRFDKQKQRVAVENNYQPKQHAQKSGHGLRHLKKKFQLLGLSEIAIDQKEKSFCVSFPVLKKHQHESADY